MQKAVRIQQNQMPVTVRSESFVTSYPSDCCSPADIRENVVRMTTAPPEVIAKRLAILKPVGIRARFLRRSRYAMGRQIPDG